MLSLLHISGLKPQLLFYFRVEENFAGGKFREIPFTVDIIFAGGKFCAKSKFAKIAKIYSTRKIGVIYIIREEGSIFAPQRIPFCMALGVAACTVGKVRVSTVFMCVCSTFRPSDFLLFVKNGFVVGVRCQGNSESLKECEYPHCASATRRLALDNRTYSAQLANSTHTHTM